MDVHRCRFVPYPASAINAIAFSHPSSSSAKKRRDIPLRLAIGRANGDIEIWNPLNGLWHQEAIIHGGKDRSIDGLVWTSEADEEAADGKITPGKLRLFSIGYTTAVTEWDLERLTAKRHASGQHGDIWCLGAQPPPPADKSRKEKLSQKLVAGTIDGCLVLFSIDDDDLQLQRIIVKSPSKKTKMVSIAFQSRHVAIVGCSDSSIRAYNLRNGGMLKKMTLGSDLVGGSKEIIVWSVKCLPNGDVVSGDSTGQVCIWDGKTYTQVQRIQSHEQDVLSLATSVNGSAIVSGGMDRRTVLYRPMTGSSGRWAKTSHRRYHKHDVKALASFEGEGISVVVSGGPDASPVVLPLREAGLENHRTLPYLPQRVPLASAPKARLLVSWWDREVHIWSLHQPAHKLLADTESAIASERNHKLVGRVMLKGEANITSASLSHDGALLVISTSAEIKAFRLDMGASDQGGKLIVRKIQAVPRGWAQGASMVQISPDGLWVCAIQNGGQATLAKIAHITSQGQTNYRFHHRTLPLKRTVRKDPNDRHLAGLGSYNRVITQVAFSADSKVLAVADLAGYIDTWLLRPREEKSPEEEEEDSSASSSGESKDVWDGLHWVTNPRARLLPRLPAAPAIISFADGGVASPERRGAEEADDYTLLAITSSMQLLLLHPLRGSIADWSRRNPSSRLPDPFQTSRDPVKGVIWQGSRVWLYGVSTLLMLDLSVDHAENDKKGGEHGAQENGASKKRKRRGETSGAGNKMERGAVGPSQVKVASSGEVATQWIDVDMRDADALSEDATIEDDEDDLLDGTELQKLREEEVANDNGSHANGVQRKAWFTYKYRPLLGAVAFDKPRASHATVQADGDPPLPLEVALVERPIWDVELPPRLFAEDEYER